MTELLGIIQCAGITSILEIGSRRGESVEMFASVLPEKSRIIAVDLPDGPWGVGGSRSRLDATIDTLSDRGFDAKAIYGDCSDTAIRNEIYDLGPFDFVHIDADHRYESVRRDWLNYGHIGRIIAFHDICAEGESIIPGGTGKFGVTKLWNQIKHGFVHREIVKPDKADMGVGVIWRDRPI